MSFFWRFFDFGPWGFVSVSIFYLIYFPISLFTPICTTKGVVHARITYWKQPTTGNGQLIGWKQKCSNLWATTLKVSSTRIGRVANHRMKTETRAPFRGHKVPREPWTKPPLSSDQTNSIFKQADYSIILRTISLQIITQSISTYT